jgi:hypothetical protein
MNKKELICEQLDAFIEDEEKAVHEYNVFKHQFIYYPHAIVNSLAIDEGKHANLLREVKAQVCQ